MYRFLLRPRWLAFTLVVAIAAGSMAMLSLWQLRRLDERRTFNSDVRERVEAPPVELGELLPLDAADEWRTVTLTGTYDAGGISTLEPAVGSYRVIETLLLDDTTAVLVERGSIPTTLSSAPPPPEGAVGITGRVRRAPDGLSALGPDAQDDEYLVQLISSEPAEDVSLGPSGLPDLDDQGPHLSYAVQWAIFAVCVAVGWVLAVRRSARPAEEPTGRAGRRRRHNAVPWQDGR